MNQNSKNLKDKIDCILEQNKRQQHNIPSRFIKEQRQNLNNSCQNKYKLNQSQEYNRKQLQINTNHNYVRGRSETSQQIDGQQQRLRISTTPNNNSCNNKENIFKKNEFLSTKNNSIKNNKVQNIQYDINLTESAIQLKQNQNFKNTIDKSNSTIEQDKSLLGKSTIDNSKSMSISKQNENLLNDSKDVFILNDLSYGNIPHINDQREQNVFKSNININNIPQNNNKNSKFNQNCKTNQTNCSIESSSVKNNKENNNLHQEITIKSDIVNNICTSNNKTPKYLNNGNISIIQGQSPKNNDIVNQLIHIIEQEKINSSKQYQQFQNQQNQNSIENIRQRESLSLQMKQASQQLDLSSTSKRGSYFGLIDSNNNVCQSDEDNSQIVRELKTKYHLRDAIQRQEIQRLEQENTILQNSNKQLDEEVNRYRNIRAMENKYIKKLEKELTEEKQKFQLFFKQYSNNEMNNTNTFDNKVSNCNIANTKESSISSNSLQNNNDIQNIPITQQNSYSVALRQEKIIQTLSEKVNELMSEKQYYEEILKNLLLKNEIDKQKQFDQFSLELSQQKPSFLNTSLTENSYIKPGKISCSNASQSNVVSKNQISINTTSQQNQFYQSNLQQASTQKIIEIKEDFVQDNSTKKAIQETSTQDQQLIQLDLPAQPYINLNQNQFPQQRENVDQIDNILDKEQFQYSLNPRSNQTPIQKNGYSAQIEQNCPTYDPSLKSSVMSNTKYQDSSEKNSNRGSGYIFGPPKSAHKCSYEEQLINKQHQNNKVIFLETEKEEQDNFYWDPNCCEFTINEKQLQGLIESYKLQSLNQKVNNQ